MTDIHEDYRLVQRRPTVTEFRALRDATEMRARSVEGVRRGLPNTLFGAVVVHEPTDSTVGMGRVVGDGGTVLLITDIAVHPSHQSLGLGTQIMESINEFIDRNAAPETYVNLLATDTEFYEQFGYEEGRPEIKAMVSRT